MLKPIKHYDKQIYQILIPIQYNLFLLTKVSLHPKPDSSQDKAKPTLAAPTKSEIEEAEDWREHRHLKSEETSTKTDSNVMPKTDISTKPGVS